MPQSSVRRRRGRVAGTGVVVGLVLVALAVSAAAQRSGPIVGRAVGRQAVAERRPTMAWVDAMAEASVRRLNHVPGEVLVKFRAGVGGHARDRALAVVRGRPTSADLDWAGSVARLWDPAEPDAERLAALLRRQPEVEFAQPNYIRHIPLRTASARVAPIRVDAAATPSRVPSDPSYGDLQWNMRIINAPGAWTINPGGRAEVIVAVLDTGFTTTRASVTRPLWTGQRIESFPLLFDTTPDLASSRVVFARDVAFEPGGVPFDFDGHGTHVASTIAEEANNAIGLAGLAYNVRVMPVKVCVGFWELMLTRASFGVGGYLPVDVGGCTDADLSAGIRYAVDSGARVINLSLGGAGDAPVVRDALQYALSRGVFVATAMGNGFEFGNEVEFPAAYAPSMPGVMSVGAIGKSKARAYYSSTGAHLEVVAPGGSDLDDDGGADLGFVWQITTFPQDTDPFETARPRFDRYGEVGYIGTSMATPHVSALAALLISQGVTNPAAIEAAIVRAATDLGPAGRDEMYGHGLVDARRSIFGLGAAR